MAGLDQNNATKLIRNPRIFIDGATAGAKATPVENPRFNASVFVLERSVGASLKELQMVAEKACGEPLGLDAVLDSPPSDKP